MTRVIGICSGKGGVGKTTVATNLALALRDSGKKVLLIDCNLSTPHIAYYMGATDYKFTLNDALAGKVDIISAVNSFYGVKYIPASLDMKDLVGIDPLGFKKHLKKLVAPKNFDFIILDAAPGLGREALTVLDAADEIIFVTNPFVPMINDVIRSVDVLKHMKGGKNVSIALNMVTGDVHEVFSKTITDVTQIPVVTEIPYDKNVVYSLVAKSMILQDSPNSRASIGIKSLAAYLTGEDFKAPTRMRVFKLLKKVKNYFTLPKVAMQQDAEAVKDEIFIEK